MVLIIEGFVDMMTKDGTKFMLLPSGSIFNDYSLLFNLKSNIQFKSHSPKSDNIRGELSSDRINTVTMNLDADKFKEILELYPKTA